MGRETHVTRRNEHVRRRGPNDVHSERRHTLRLGSELSMKRAELYAATQNTWVVPIDGAKTGPHLTFMGIHDDEVEFVGTVYVPETDDPVARENGTRRGYIRLPVEHVLNEWEVWNP